MQWYATVLIQLSSASSSLLHFSKGNKLVIVLINPKWSNLVCRSSLSTIISYLCYIILGACNSHWEERVDGKPEADFYPLTALSLCLIKKKKNKKLPDLSLYCPPHLSASPQPAREMALSQLQTWTPRLQGLRAPCKVTKLQEAKLWWSNSNFLFLPYSFPFFFSFLPQ